MNRQLKFRAWDGRHMRHDVTIYGNRFIDCSNADEDIFFKWHDPSEEVAIMQYTGLKDKNGKEIYEGDIVQGFRSAMATDGKVRKKYPQNVRVFLEVKWSDGKNYDCGFYLKQIKYHPADKEATDYNQYRRIQYRLQESRDPHLIDNEIIPWHGKSEYVEVIGNIFENPELIQP